MGQSYQQSNERWQEANNMNEFGIKVTELRERLHVSKKELGLMIGVSDSTISRWERGKAKPQNNETIERLISVANGLR